MPRGKSYNAQELALIDHILRKAPAGTNPASNEKRARFVVGLRRKLGLSTTQVPKNVTFLKDAERIRSFLEEHYSGASLATQLSHTALVSKWFGYKAAYEVLSRASTVQSSKYAEEVARQNPTQAQRDNWVEMEELRARTAAHVAAMNALKVSRNPRTPEEKKTIQLALASWLNTEEPPCRSIYATAKFVFENPPNDQLLHGKPNLVHIPKSLKSLARLYVNTDKVSNTEVRGGNSGPDSWDLSAETTALLRRSLRLWKRPYVMYDTEEEGKGYQALVQEALSPEGKKVGVRLVRNIYISDFYKTHASPSLAEKKLLAAKMRHSASVQEAVYRRLV